MPWFSLNIDLHVYMSLPSVTMSYRSMLVYKSQQLNQNKLCNVQFVGIVNIVT